MQIKTTSKYHYILNRMATIKKILTMPSARKDAEQLEVSYFTHWNAKWYSPSGKQFGSVVFFFFFFNTVKHMLTI